MSIEADECATRDMELLPALRAAELDYTLEWGSGDLYGAAADEIERLRAALDAALAAGAAEPVLRVETGYGLYTTQPAPEAPTPRVSPAAPVGEYPPLPEPRYAELPYYFDADMRAYVDADRAQRLAAPLAAPKPLDDPRLQGLFSDAISGALAFGAQNTNPPPAGHWLERFWQMGRAALSEGPQKERPDFIAGYDAGLIDGRACAARDTAPPAAEPVAPESDLCELGGRCLVGERGGDYCGNAECALIDAATAAPAVPQTEPVDLHDELERLYAEQAEELSAGGMRQRNAALALMRAIWAAPQTEKDAAPSDYAKFLAWARPFVWSGDKAAMDLAWLSFRAGAFAAKPAESQTARPRDYCTDPGNCKRCKAATWDQTNHAHAGIPLGAQRAAMATEQPK
jgi:hypothetical protein